MGVTDPSCNLRELPVSSQTQRVQPVRIYLTAKCVGIMKERECLDTDCVKWYKSWREGGGFKGFLPVSACRAAGRLHGIKTQTQTLPGPPHLPLCDTSTERENNHPTSPKIPQSGIHLLIKSQCFGTKKTASSQKRREAE